MELVSAYLGLQKARAWKSEKVNYLPGAYAIAMKHIYGDQHVHVDLYANRELLSTRKSGDIVTFKSELV
jgi:hypothetical protein